MQSQEGSIHHTGDQLPSLTEHKRKSSLRSLQEIQQRRSANQSAAQSRQTDVGFYPNTQDKMLLSQSQRLSRSRGRSQMEEAAVDERSQVIHLGLRKRTPSESRRSQVIVTPSKKESEISQERQHAITISGARSSFKQQLEPLNQNTLSQMAQTHRAGGSSSQQIGPLFSQSNANLNQTADEERSARRNTLRGHTGRPSMMMRHAQAQERHRASTFSFQNANPKQVSDFLQAIIQQPLSMLYQKPFDLDSTEPLDSFLDALYFMVSDNVCDYNETVQQRIHLATGVRTEVCEDVLQYFAQLQTRNKLLNNAVQFFNEYLTKISELEGDKEQREVQVNKLIMDKEQLFLTKYDLEKKLEEMSTTLKAAKATEGDAATQMKSLHKRYEAKVAECESLMFRLRHLEEMSQMLEPPMGNSTTNINLADTPGAKPLTHLETFSENLRMVPPSPNPRMSNVVALNQQEIDRLRGLQEANRKLELELSLLKETLNSQQNERFNVNIDHYVRIQELQNKVQIENKQLRVTNKKLETKIDSSNRQIQHLEDKIHAVSKEKELIIVNLKSEIKLLTRNIEENVRNFESRLQSENTRFQKEFQQNFSGQEKRLKDEKDQLVREKADLDTKISQLQNQLEQMAADFSKYRADITKKDIEKEQSITELQTRLKQSGQLNESQTRLLQERIETFNNQNQVLAKQNSIIDLKLRLIRDSVETLYKQKMFIVENIERSRRDLAKESAQVEANMMSENGNQEYLISVKKAVKISQTMVDLGLNAIQNVANIVAFLKIDEVRNLIVNQEQSSQEVTKAAMESGTLLKKETQQQEIEKLNLLFQQEDIQDEPVNQHLLTERVGQVQTTQGLRLKNFITIPEGQDDSKTEDHYYNNCPVELSSILSKVLADTLATFGVKELPMPLQKLVQLGSRKADPQVEQEIYMSHLADSKRMVEERYMQLNSELVNLKKQGSRDRLSNRLNDENMVPQSSGLKSRLKTNSSNNELLQEVSNRQNSIQREGSLVQQQKRTIRSNDSRRPQSAVKPSPIRQPLRVPLNQQESESKLDSLKIQLQEQKLKHKEITMQLASKIVLLEEELDEKRMGQEQDLSELESQQKDELERTKQGIKQREQELLIRSNEFRARAERAEQELGELRGQVVFLNKEIERISGFQRDFDLILGTKEAELTAYQENVSQYLNLRVSERNMFGLTIEINSQNQSMISEAMLKYILNVCLKIDKSKFRFISTEQEHFAIQRPGDQKEETDEDEEVAVVKIIIEIVDDQINVDRYFKQMKHQIREGQSLLYDITPLYLSINLGQCGLSPKDKSVYLKDFHFIKRKGIVIGKEDFVVTVLRHKQDPLNFKILAANADASQGQEYILDLQQRDLFELTEGNHTILEESEPSLLVDSMIDNLTLITNASTGVRTLACEHKVYFNPIFVNKHVPQGQKLGDVNHPNKEGFETTQPSTDSLAFRTTNFRNKQILDHVANPVKATELYKGKMRRDADCQTELQHTSSMSSILNLPRSNGSSSQDEAYVSTYQGYQRVGKNLELKIKIEEGQKSGTTLVTFEELRSRDKCQICLLESSQSIGRDRYVIHSECVKFHIQDPHAQRDPYTQQLPPPEPHLVLLTFERFQEDGYLIKLHDMKQGASEEFFIVKKSNGQYARLTRPAGIEAILSNGKEHEELRNLIFDLTFTLGIPSQQILYANLAAAEQQQMGNEEDLLQMPIMKKPGQVQENQKNQHITDLLRSAVDQLRILPAYARYQSDPYQLPSGVLLQKHDRGELLYRNVFTVRCMFERQDETEHESLISFYVKKDAVISVEVFLYKEAQKMSIVSQVSSMELFGNDHQSLSFLQKTEMLDQMMEKMYVLSESGHYHLKVENEAIPMSVLLEERKNVPPPPPPPVNPDAPIIPPQPKDRPSSEMGKQHYSQLELKKQEILENKASSLAPERTIKVKTYAQINEKLHEYVAYFMLKPEKEAPILQISPSKKSKVKKQVERQTSISNNIEDIVDFEYILVEVKDGGEGTYTTLLSLKRLGAIMMSNPFEMQLNWQIIQSKDKEKLVEYLKAHTKIDTLTNELKIESFQPNKELILQLYTNEIGGIYIRRDQNDGSLDLEKEIVEKTLLMNQEVDMSEFSYDVKLFQVFNRHKERQTLSYSFEIFSHNEPDLIFRYNYALHEQSSYVHSPIHIGYDIINLVENPLSRLKQNEEAKRRGEFSQVFQKYIDNRLLLVVNEQIFPHQISFCLYESSSRLHWQYTFDPQQADPDFIQAMAKTSLSGRWNIEIGQLSIMDQGTAERFLALIMNEVIDQSANAPCAQVELREDNWADLGDMEALRYDLVKNRQVGNDISVTLSKMGVDCIKIEVRNLLFGAAPIGKGSSSENPSSPAVLEDDRNAVQFIVNASQRNKFVCKLLKLRDQPMNRILILICDLKECDIQVKIIELMSSTLVTQADAMKSIKLSVLYNYIFREKKAQTHVNLNFIVEQQHLQEALAEVCTSGQNGNTTTQVMEKATKLYQVLAGKQQVKETLSIFQDRLSVSQRRLIASANNQSGGKGDKQSLILHRKTFFDESHEKLIIVSVSVDCNLSRKKGHGTAQLVLNDVTSFKLLINEPETNRKMDFTVAVESAFLEEELVNGLDLKNIQHLKRMAKLLIEERAIIKRVSKDTPEGEGQDSNLYTVDINLYHINPMNWQSNSSQTPAGIQQNEQEQQSINKGVGGSKSKNTNSLDNGASSSIKNVGHIPEDEGSDEFEAMESALAASKTLQNVKVSSGQTNLAAMVGPVSQVMKSQSFRHGGADILPPQQSIIEEEGSQEEYEESPDHPNRARRQRQIEEHYENTEADQDGRGAQLNNDRYQLPEDENEQMLREQYHAQNAGRDFGNSQQRHQEEDEDDMDRSVESIAEVLFERPVSESAVLQILTPSRRDPYQIFQVRQIRIDDGQIIMRIGIEQEIMDDIMERADLQEEDLQQQKPELFESIAEYILYNVIRK